jgi:DNA-binding CsgD family transcriptional regulator
VSDEGPQLDVPGWREVVAAGVVAEDLTVGGLARFAEVPRDVALQALSSAREAGLLVDGVVDEDAAATLTALLEPTDVDRIHAAAALHLAMQGPERVPAALGHALAADSADQSALIRLIVTSGRLALAAGDHTIARTLLAAAVELGATDGEGPVPRARLLFDLARASDGCGGGEEARDLLLDVIRLAASAGEHDLLVDAAIRFVFPVDWRAGDRQAAALLDLAESSEADGPRIAGILAARAMVEMRRPATEEQGHQVAWVTRATVAQPLAERAVYLTNGTSSADRLVALSAWRCTHRGPEHLPRRLEVSREALDLAQRQLDHERLVDAAVTTAVDHLESGDRSAYDESIAMVTWTAATDGNPRLQWWAAVTAAGAALLDGDHESSARHRAEAGAIGERAGLPGWLSGEIVLAAQTAVATEDADALRRYLVPVNTPIATSPLARSMVVWAATALGDVELARRHARVARRTLDEESSYLLCLTLLASAAASGGDAELAATCRERLEPWTGRVAVDAHGWWCHGPVDLALAELATSAGRLDAASAHLAAGAELAASTGDVRAITRAERIAARLATPPTAGSGARRPPVVALPALATLSEREHAVLVLLANGSTNAEIAAQLSYSPSTIRIDTMSIYRKLGVQGRVDATAVAVSAGLTDPIGGGLAQSDASSS